MSGYAKLFGDIVTSSIWRESPETKVVWITMLALADADGNVRGSPGWLAMTAGVNYGNCNAALKKFLSPDASSRTPDNEGRRIVVTPSGWRILNYAAHRARDGKTLASGGRSAYMRDYMRKYRETEKKDDAHQAGAKKRRKVMRQEKEIV